MTPGRLARIRVRGLPAGTEVVPAVLARHTCSSAETGRETACGRATGSPMLGGMSDVAQPQSDPSTEEPVEAGTARTFGWSDMFVHPDDDPRSDSGQFEDERAMFASYLRDVRLTLEMKCSGLDAAELARRSVEPSNLSLLGLVRHLAGVEQTWFRVRMAGQEVPRHFRSEADPDGGLTGATPDPGVVTQAWDTWRPEVAFAEQFVAEAPDLDLLGKDGDV